jgi:hypothetical protein
MPPELSRPYPSSAEKERDWQLLLQRAARLKEWAGLSETPETEWPEADVAALRVAPPITDETPSQRLSHWRRVFADELSELGTAVDAAATAGGPGRITDLDLRSAVYLAGRLLATLYGVPADEV